MLTPRLRNIWMPKPAFGDFKLSTYDGRVLLCRLYCFFFGGFNLVKFADVQKDMEKISHETKTVFVDYNLLHRFNTSDNSEFNWEALFKPAQKLFGSNYKNILFEEGILTPTPNGGYTYDLNKISLAFGGGQNTTIYDKHIAVCHLAHNRERMHTIYHEAAHSWQQKQHLFNYKKIERIYRFCKKGLIRSGNSHLANCLIENFLYTKYLHEAHAEAFADFCMLLRTTNPTDRFMQKCTNYNKTIIKIFVDMMEPRDAYPAAKYYASLPICKQVAKKFDYWRKNKQLNRFYSADGSLNFSLISHEMAKIVYKHAYTPHSFKYLPWSCQFEALLTIYPILTMQSLKSLGSFFSVSKHLLISLRAKLTLPKSIKLKNNDYESRIINDCCKIDNAKTNVLKQTSNNGLKNGFVLAYLELIMQMVSENMEFEQHLNSMKSILTSNGNKKAICKAIDNFVKVTQKAFANHANEPEFYLTAMYLTNHQHRDQLWQLRQEKANNPQKPVLKHILQSVHLYNIYKKVQEMEEKRSKIYKKSKKSSLTQPKTNSNAWLYKRGNTR